MRFFVVLVIIVLLVWKLWPQSPPPPVEETFIGPQLESLERARQVEQQYEEGLERKNEEMDRQSDGG